MSRQNAEKVARQMVMSGYRHHIYEEECSLYKWLFQLEREEFSQKVNDALIDKAYLRYVEILGPNRLRALKNSIICLIYSVCRMAINEGVESEFSFALSDYYINQMELMTDEQELQTFMGDVMLHYYDLTQNERRRAFTKPIASAVRYIGNNLYGTCTVDEVAKHVRLEKHYFTTLFTQQVGIPPSHYIRQRKLEEAKRILSGQNITVTATAEALGFCDTAHFSRCFKQAFGITPTMLKQRDASLR